MLLSLLFTLSLSLLFIAPLGLAGSGLEGISSRDFHVRDPEDITAAYASLSQPSSFESAPRVSGRGCA